MPDNSIVVKEDAKVGRPCKYETEIEPRLNEIYEWVKAGYTDYSIADNLGIHQNTLIRYRENYSNLSEAYARARLERNNLVMNKMLQRATGEKVTLVKQKATKDGEILDLVEEQYIPPDVNAADLFLRNNDPDYKSAKQVETGNVTINNYQLPQLTDQLKQIEEQRRNLEMQLNSGVWEIDKG